MFDSGIIVGKFYPPTKGHSYLIETGLEQCRELTVILAFRQGESISPFLRSKWLSSLFPTAQIMAIEIPETLLDTDSRGWAEFTIQLLGDIPPDAVFTSEDYGDPWAKYLNAVHVLVDKKRIAVPISATMVRSNPLKWAKYLEPVVKAHFAIRIAFVGAESTGKTTLAKALAEEWKTGWVPEYGRFYSEGKNSNEWRTEEFDMIARGQAMLEDQIAESVDGLLFCDTDLMLTAMWHDRYLNAPSPRIMQAGLSRKYDLYVLTGSEIPWVYDGLRDGGHIRQDMQNKIRALLIEKKLPFIEVTGSIIDRMGAVSEQIKRLLDAKNS